MKTQLSTSSTYTDLSQYHIIDCRAALISPLPWYVEHAAAVFNTDKTVKYISNSHF